MVYTKDPQAAGSRYRAQTIPRSMRENKTGSFSVASSQNAMLCQIKKDERDPQRARHGEVEQYLSGG